MAPRVKVSPRDDGADITVDGYIIEITIKPVETPPQAPESSPHPAHLTVAAEEPAEPHIDTIIEGLRLDLAPYIQDLSITEEEGHIVVTPKGYLGRKKFNPIASIIRQMGGHYVSADKMSRFLIPVRKEEPT